MPAFCLVTLRCRDAEIALAVGNDGQFALFAAAVGRGVGGRSALHSQPGPRGEPRGAGSRSGDLLPDPSMNGLEFPAGGQGACRRARHRGGGFRRPAEQQRPASGSWKLNMQRPASSVCWVSL